MKSSNHEYIDFDEENESNNKLSLAETLKTGSEINNGSVLVKLNEKDFNNDINIDDVDINKIEEKLNHQKNPELFTRENQYSVPVDEIIEVPKKKIKDENIILRDEQRNEQIKKQIMEKENQIDKKEREIENAKNEEKIKQFNDRVKRFKRIRKKKNLILYIEIVVIAILITTFIILLIIYLDD